MTGRVDIDARKALSVRAPLFSKAQKFLDSEVLRTSAPFVPMRTGELMRSGTRGTKIGSGEVIYVAPYSRKMYYGSGLNFRTDKHPQARAFWFEAAKAIHKDAWLRGVQEIARGG